LVADERYETPDAMTRGASGEAPCRAIARQLLVLIRDYWLYFSKDEILNSDGRRLLASATRRLSHRCSRAERALARAFREPSLDNILRLLEYLDQDVAEEARAMLAPSMWGPGFWRSRETG